MVEQGAAKLQALARKAAGRGDGIGEWLSEELQADADFLRKLKPSLIAARARGERASEPEPQPQPPPQANPGPAAPKKKRKRSGGGPSPVLVVGAALVAGIVLAKVVDWRGHAHPRD